MGRWIKILSILSLVLQVIGGGDLYPSGLVCSQNVVLFIYVVTLPLLTELVVTMRDIEFILV